MDEKHLKTIYADVEATDAEMDRYRAGLFKANSADGTESVWYRRFLSVDKMRAYLNRTSLAWAPLPVFLFLAIVMMKNYQSPSFVTIENLGDLLAVVESASDTNLLSLESEQLLSSDEDMERWNAYLVLSMIGEDKLRSSVAARGLLEDARPEFRAHHLETLLDQSNSLAFNVEAIEIQMYEEGDEICLELFEELLHVAISRS